MADKTVKVRIAAEASQYLAQMRQVHEQTLKAAEAADKAKERLELQSQAMEKVGTVAMGAGLALLGFAGAAAMTAANFDEAMSAVQSATDATAEDMNRLREAAIQAGADTAFSATEAAQGIEELAKAGVSVSDILNGGLGGALDLAAAGQISVADAAETAASAMTQFKLAGSDVPHIADLLAAGAQKAQGGVSDLAGALNQSGLVASQMGLSVEEAVGSLAAFASAGMIGSDAGTSFRTMLMRLQNPTGEAAAQLEELGISAYDTNGQFVGMANLAGQLRDGLSGLTPQAKNAAMAIIFGQDAVRAANVLYDQGAEGIRGWISAVDDSGAAYRIAAQKMDNLKGDLEKLGGSWETAMIRLGASAQGPLRSVVQVAADAIDKLSALDPVVQGVALGVVTLSGAVLATGGAALVLIPQIAATNAALATLGGISGAATLALGSLRGALVAVASNPLTWMLATAAVAVAALNREIEAGVPTQTELGVALRDSASAADLLAQAAKRSETEVTLMGDYGEKLQDLPTVLDRAAEATGQFGGQFMNLTVAEKGAVDSLSRLGQAIGELAGSNLPEAQRQFKGLVDQYQLTDAQQMTLLDTMGDYKQALLDQAAATGTTIGDLSTIEGQAQLLALANGDAAMSTGNLVDELSEQGAAAQDSSGKIDELVDSIRGYNDVLYGSITSEIDFRDAVDRVNESIAQNGQTLDLTTEAGRANQAALIDLAQSSHDFAASTYELDGDVAGLNARLQEGWNEMYNAVTAMGYEGQAAVDLTNKLYGIPTSIASAVQVETQDAQNQIDWFITRNNNREVRIVGVVDMPSGGTMTQYGDGGFSTGGMKGYAYGGPVTGGVRGKDSVLAWLMPDEHVLTAAEVAAAGGHQAVHALRAALRNGMSLPRFASGGPVAGATSYSTSYQNISNKDIRIEMPIQGAQGMDIYTLADFITNQVMRAVKYS